MSSSATPYDTEKIKKMLSEERLKSLLELTGSLHAAIDLHQSTLRLSGQLMTLIATLEIALRNSICENLTEHFGGSGWLYQTPVSFRWKEPERKKIEQAIDSARRAEYAKLTQGQKASLDARAYPAGRPPQTSHLKRAKDRRKYIPITHGKIVAELTLYFWKRLYGPEYEQALWRPTLKRTFPDKRLCRAQIAVELERLYQARNRLAHHEPVLHKRFHDTISSIRFIAEHLQEKKANASSALSLLITSDLEQTEANAEELHAQLDHYRTR